MRLLLGFLFLCYCCPARAQHSGDEAAIRELLSRQVSEWNRGNVAGYMQGYWESDSLVFIGKSGPTYGYQATLARYQKSYPDAAHMGQLTASPLRIRLLAQDWAYVTGRWQLKRVAGNLSGYYTLLLRKLAGHWVIVEDHSS
ncbi:MAG: nuclear transport factor 2 family protein [Bacteroidetes bacterium]|nr:nuclear transport factor 2 family protein [Bacteroidota bacterium]MBS1629602.1 nuclear transport factor 2 family protein [Bacteroidota bacterium]